MKKIIFMLPIFVYIFCSIIFVNKSMLATEVSTTSQTSGFAIIKNNSSYLYKNNYDNQLSEKYFLLEKTYFVKILENLSNGYYKAEYCGVIGFVKSDDIEFVEEVPLMPYLDNITFDIYSASSVNLWTEPTTQNGIGSIVSTLPSSKKSLTYYGKITGEETVKGLGNIWYYCSYTLDSGQKVFGYIYSPHTINLSPINENNETVTTVSIKDYVPLTSLLYLDLSTKNLIILVIALPTLYIIYLFLKPSKILRE